MEKPLYLALFHFNLEFGMIYYSNAFIMTPGYIKGYKEWPIRDSKIITLKSTCCNAKVLYPFPFLVRYAPRDVSSYFCIVWACVWEEAEMPLLINAFFIVLFITGMFFFIGTLLAHGCLQYLCM